MSVDTKYYRFNNKRNYSIDQCVQDLILACCQHYPQAIEYRLDLQTTNIQMHHATAKIKHAMVA